MPKTPSRPNVGYYRALEIESEVYAALADVLEDHDILICPTFSVPALKAAMADYDFDVLFRYGMTLPSTCAAAARSSSCLRALAPTVFRSACRSSGRTYDDVERLRAAAAAFARRSPWFHAARMADRPD